MKLELNTAQRLLMTNISIGLVVFWAILCAIPCLGDEGLYEIDYSEIASQLTIDAKAPVILFNLLSPAQARTACQALGAPRTPSSVLLEHPCTRRESQQ